MQLIKLFILSISMLTALATSAVAQRRSYPPPLPGAFEILEPRTRLEEFETRVESVLVTGSSRIAILNTQPGILRVDATELRDEGKSDRATGISIFVREFNRAGREGERQGGTTGFDFGSRALIDYEEIDPLIKALDTVAKADETITKHTRFDVRYRTRGDLEVIVFRQTTGGNAAAVSAGYFEKSTLLLSLDELVRFRHMIHEAKVRLDQLR